MRTHVPKSHARFLYYFVAFCGYFPFLSLFCATAKRPNASRLSPEWFRRIVTPMFFQQQICKSIRRRLGQRLSVSYTILGQDPERVLLGSLLLQINSASCNWSTLSSAQGRAYVALVLAAGLSREHLHQLPRVSWSIVLRLLQRIPSGNSSQKKKKFLKI